MSKKAKTKNIWWPTVFKTANKKTIIVSASSNRKSSLDDRK